MRICRDLVRVYRNLGLSLHKDGKLGRALPSLRKAVQIGERLLRQSENNMEAKSDLAISLHAQAHALFENGQIEDSLRDCMRSRRIFKKLSAESDRIEFQKNLADNFNLAGMVYGIQRRADESIEAFNESIRIFNRLVDERGQRNLEVFLASSLRNRGLTFAEERNWESAIQDYDKVIAIHSRLIEGENRDEFKTDLAGILRAKGIGLNNLHKPDAAIADFRDSIQILSKLHRTDEQPQTRRELALSLSEMAWVQSTSLQESVRDGSNAVDYAKQACELTDWENDMMIGTLSAAYGEVEDFEKAKKYLSDAIKKAPDNFRETRSEMMELFSDRKPYRQRFPDKSVSR